MYSDYNSYYGSTPVYNPYGYPLPYWANAPIYNPDPWQVYIPPRDYGPNPMWLISMMPLCKTIISVFPYGRGPTCSLPNEHKCGRRHRP